MLTSLRASAQGFLAKLIMLFLVGLFVLWGIGDVFRAGGSGGNVASVGRTSISMQQYQIALRRRQEELRQMLGSSYKPELLKRLGIGPQVLSGLINNLLVAKETTALGLAVSDDDIATTIAANPAFHDENGHFDKMLYGAALRNNGVAEQRYVEDLRKELTAKLLVSTLSSPAPVSDDLVQALYKARHEQRIGELLVIPASAAGQAPALSDKDIKAYYDAHASAFLAPEVRSISYVELKLADVQAKIEVPQADIQHTYEDRIQEFRKPERRAIEQMLFENEADAKKAADKLVHGGHFSDVAKSSPLVNKDKISLGLLFKQDTPSVAADAVFALKENDSSAPIQTPFGWTIFHVSKIEPESTPPLAAVRADIVKDLSAKAAQETQYKLINSMEDALASGATLEKAAEQIGQGVHTLGAMTRDGKSPDGRKLALPPYENFLAVAFTVAEKDHSQATQAGDGSYFLVRADSVTPEHTRPLAEVKDKAIAGLREEKEQALLKDVSEKVVADLHAGKSAQDALAAHHVSITAASSGKLTRSSDKTTEGPLAGKALPQPLVLELFSVKPHQSTHAYMAADGSRVIATLSQVIPAPAADAKALQSIRDELKEAMQTEMLQHYLTYLRGKYHVSINEAALSAIVGEEDKE